MRRLAEYIVCLVTATSLALLGPSPTVLAAAGDLDPAFNRSGLVITDLQADDRADDLVITARGQVIVGGVSVSDVDGDGDLALVRYTPRGRLDRRFGEGGRVLTDVDPSAARSWDAIHAMALQEDGKVVVAGETNVNGNIDVVLARYLTVGRGAGRLDASFGEDGLVVTDLSGSDHHDLAVDLVVEPDGILVTGSVSDGTGRWDPAVARYDLDGVLDTSFGVRGDGVTVVQFYPFSVQTTGMAIQGDGRIVVAGTLTRPGIPAVRDFSLTRLTVDGHLDLTFGFEGVETEDLGMVALGYSTQEDAFDVVMQPNGGSERILVVGQLQFSSGAIDVVLVRFTLGGSLDATFDGDGIKTDDLGNQDSGQALAMRADGTFAVTGYSFLGDVDLAISYYDAAGIQTASLLYVIGHHAQGQGIAWAPDGRAVVVGSADSLTSTETDFAVLKLLAA